MSIPMEKEHKFDAEERIMVKFRSRRAQFSAFITLNTYHLAVKVEVTEVSGDVDDEMVQKICEDTAKSYVSYMILGEE